MFAGNRSGYSEARLGRVTKTGKVPPLRAAGPTNLTPDSSANLPCDPYIKGGTRREYCRNAASLGLCLTAVSRASGRIRHLASPRKTVSARFNRTTSSSLSLPIRLPILALGTVITLSIITFEALSRPLRSEGSMVIRSNGASVGSVVNAQRVIEAVWSNRSSCTMTALNPSKDFLAWKKGVRQTTRKTRRRC
jgi:hypothetical protein